MAFTRKAWYDDDEMKARVETQKKFVLWQSVAKGSEVKVTAMTLRLNRVAWLQGLDAANVCISDHQSNAGSVDARHSCCLWLVVPSSIQISSLSRCLSKSLLKWLRIGRLGCSSFAEVLATLSYMHTYRFHACMPD